MARNGIDSTLCAPAAAAGAFASFEHLPMREDRVTDGDDRDAAIGSAISNIAGNTGSAFFSANG